MNNYEVLELTNNASQEEITRSYRCLALRYHPDRNKDPNSAKKFMKISEAYEALCKEKKGSTENDVAVFLLKPGRKVSVTSPDEHSFAEVSQGNALFFGTLTMSQDKQFSVVYSDGYGDSKKWINGKVLLVEKDILLWIKEYERPCNGAVSDSGRVVLIRTITRDYARISSSPKEFIDLGCKLSILERSGEEIATYEFGSNVGPCVISPDGNLVSVATAMPDNTVYCFEPGKNRLLWKYKNHNKMGVVLGLKFRANEIEVFSGSNTASNEKEYALNLDGTLTQHYEMELRTLNKIKKLPTRERVEPVLEMIKSNNSREVLQGLFELKSLVTTKRSLSQYARIVDTLRSRLQDDDLFYLVWEVIRKMLRMDPLVPGIIDPLVPGIISWFKNKPESHHITAFLSALGELGRANPVWIKDELEFIKRKLHSKDWNERRYAAIAVGSISSAEPSFVSDVIPILIEYASDPERLRKELEDLNRENSYSKSFTAPPFNVKFTVSTSMDTIGPTWVQDACIDAIGMIGKRSPESVKDAIPMLEKISKNAPSPYTIKKALRALESLRGTIGEYKPRK